MPERVPAKRRASASVTPFHPDWLVLHELSRDIAVALREHASGVLLDIGCGERPYQAYAPSAVSRWIGLDREESSHPDVFGDAYHVPLEDESVDTVLCTQVLEHLEDPPRALTEMNRVLRPGSVAIVSAPQYWPLHEEPRDFYRFTVPGITYLMETNGFEVVAIFSQGRSAAVVGQALNNAILMLGESLSYSRETWFKFAKAPFYVCINLMTVVLSVVLKSKRDVLNHLVVVRKVVSKQEAGV